MALYTLSILGMHSSASMNIFSIPYIEHSIYRASLGKLFFLFCFFRKKEAFRSQFRVVLRARILSYIHSDTRSSAGAGNGTIITYNNNIIIIFTY